MTVAGARVAGQWAVLGVLIAVLGGPTNAATEDVRLARAAQRDDLAGVRALLREKADVNGREPDGSTAILWSAYQSNIEIARLLIAAKADVNAANRFGMTPLLQASRLGNAAFVDALLKAGADPAMRHPEGETTLMAAAGSGSVEAVKLLLTRGLDVNAIEGAQNQTALMWAAVEGHAAVIKALIEAGAKPNLSARADGLGRNRMFDAGRAWVDHPSGGLTALMFAARNGHLASVRALLDGGANPTALTPDNLSAMLLAVINARLDVAALLLERGADANDGSLYEAANLNNLRTTDTAGDATRPRRVHDNLLSPVDLIGKLLEKGADPRRTTVHTLHQDGTIGGGGAGALNPVNDTALGRAIRGQDVAVLRVMLAKGLDPNAALGNALPLATAIGAGAGRGGGAFRYRSERGQVEAVKALLEGGADVNRSVANGDTPLHAAAQSGNVAIIQLLVDRGAKLDVKNAAGFTPLDVAMGRQAPGAGAGRGGPPAPGPGGRGGGPQPQPQAIALLRQLMGLPTLSPQEMPAAAPAGPRGGL